MTQAFPLNSVRLLDGPFKRAMELDRDYLLSLDADRLLAGFRLNAGLPEKAKTYGGWESRGLSGHTLGHYLSACSMMYASTGDERCHAVVNHIIDELAACQAAAPDGFLGGMPNGRVLFAEITKGDFGAKGGFDLHGAWVPWYNQHKLFAGLRDAYLYTGSESARSVLVRLGDWAITVCQNLNDDQMQRMLSVEHGGMNETLADLTAITGDPKYLALARRFWHKAVLDPLAAGQDDLTGLHANTQIPKVIGCARIYELTGDEKAKRVAETFWKAVTVSRSFVTGSNSDREHFFPLNVEAGHFGPEDGETCNVYNMLKLTAHLARWSGDAKPFDYYERALFNHILGSIDPNSGMCTYFQSLEPGRFKVYGTPTDSFWCCTGTGMENHAKYGADIYSQVGSDGIDVNLFIPSELIWKERGIVLTQTTEFPRSDSTTLTFKLDKPTRLTLRIRVPSWATQGITVDGAVSAHGDSSSGWLSFNDHLWSTGEHITVHLPMALQLHRAVDDPTMAAIEKGPIVLAAELGRADFPDTDLVHDHTVFDNRPVPAVPLVLSDANTLDWLEPVADQPLHYQTHGVGKPADMQFIPIADVHHERYQVYFRLLNSAQYATMQQKLAAEQEAARQLATRTVDSVAFGEQQSEQDHAVQSKNSSTGRERNRPWRDATDGGFFSAKLAIKPNTAQVLRCTYYGSDKNRTFDILIDGKPLVTETLTAAHPGQFVDTDYVLPPDLLAGKDVVTIEFRPHDKSIAGGLFGCRVMLTDSPG